MMTESENRRPSFIPREWFRVYAQGTMLNKFARIDNIKVTSFIERCKRLGHAVPSVPGFGAVRLYRMIDIVTRAGVYGLSVTKPIKKDLLPIAVRRELRAHALMSAEATASPSSLVRDSSTHALAINVLSKRLTDSSLLTPEELLAGRMDLPTQSGVYFLFSGDRVVYVGQAIKVMRRVIDHIGQKDVDGFAFIPTEPKHLDILESLYIHALRPTFNGKWRNGEVMHAPLGLNKMLEIHQPQMEP